MRYAQLLLWAVALCVLVLSDGTLSTTHAQVLSTNDSLILVDANQTIVGPVIGFGGIGRGQGADVVFQVDPFLVTLVARIDKFEGIFRALWESPDCTGNPVIDAEADELDLQLFAPVTVAPAITPGKPLGKVYVVDPNDTPHEVRIRAFSALPSGCNPNKDDDMVVVNTIEILDLDALFTPPFHATVVSETRKGGGPKKK